MAFLGTLTWILGLTEIQSSTVSKYGAFSFQPNHSTSTRVYGPVENVVISTEFIEINWSIPKATRTSTVVHANKWRRGDHKLYRFEANLTGSAISVLALLTSKRAEVQLSWREPDGVYQYASSTPELWLLGDSTINALVELPDRVSDIGLHFELYNAGSWRLSNARLCAVELTSTYRWGLFLLAIAWILWFFAFLRLLFQSGTKVVPALFILMSAVGCFGMLIGQAALKGMLHPIFTFFMLGDVDANLDLFSRMLELGHFIAFCLITIILAPLWFQHRIGLRWMVGFLLLLAPVTEVLQMHVISRSTQILDIFVDILGVAFAFLILSCARIFSVR